MAQVLKISSAYTPPPPEGFISPMLWGVKQHVVERFESAGIQRDKISFVKDSFTFNSSHAPIEIVSNFKNFYGPTMNAFEAAEKNGKTNNLEQELQELFTTQNKSKIKDTTSIDASFLLVTVEC